MDRNESEKMFIVECDFIPGSDARGCMIVLVGEDYNTTVNASRCEYHAKGMITVICPLTNYIRVIAYDIESDGSVGSLAVQGKLFNNITMCREIKQEMESSLSKFSCRIDNI